MCGIAGIFNYYLDKKVDRDTLMKMNAHMQSRGPDGAGVWLSANESIGLAHRRLSIIDLSNNANQPLHDERFSIVFNGEIYNYKILREQLIQQGFQFKTHSDTEVLLKLYQSRGVEMLHALRGMFAFAIWDEKNQTLFCARDPFGIKPFYFSDDGYCFQFASQVKTLLPQVNQAVSAAGQVGFYLLGSVPEPHTLYENIHALPAGSYCLIQKNKKRIQKEYYSIRSAFINAENNVTNNPLSLTDCLYDTVKHHLVSDVDVGVFLSAGIDSSTLANIVSEIAAPPKTMTLGFSEYRGTDKDEVPLAEFIAQGFGTHHQTRWLSEEIAQAEKEKIFSHMDQPSIDGINTYFVSMLASQLGMKVALSGLGADELFAGYAHFSLIPKAIRVAKPFSWLGKPFRYCTKGRLHPKKASLLEYGYDVPHAYILARGLFLPWELETVLDREVIKKGMAELNLFNRLQNDVEGIQSTRFRISALELQWYMRNQLLRDSDWASMAHSLEIRTPFVDVRFFENVIQLIAQCELSKNDLAMASNRKLPDAILHRKKTGFNIPVAKWFSKSNNMKSFAKVVLGHITR